jgi:hypothetical protein
MKANADEGDPAAAGSFGTVALCACMAGVELALLAVVARGVAELVAALAVHAAVVATLSFWTLRLARTNRLDRRYCLFAVATAGLGPIGVAGFALSELLLRHMRTTATPFETWYATLCPSYPADPVRTRVRQIRRARSGAAGASAVAPFGDVMADGTVEQKQAVIALIAENFTPSFAPALRQALSDEEQTVRIQAALATTRFENRFLRRSMELAGVDSMADDGADVLLQLARHHDDYANSGLLDAVRLGAARRRALDLYVQYDALRPGEPKVLHAMSRLLVRLERDEDAVERLEPLVRRAEAPAESMSWYLECLYRLRRYETLREASSQLGTHLEATGRSSDPVRQATALWVAYPPEQAAA